MLSSILEKSYRTTLAGYLGQPYPDTRLESNDNLLDLLENERPSVTHLVLVEMHVDVLFQPVLESYVNVWFGFPGIHTRYPALIDSVIHVLEEHALALDQLAGFVFRDGNKFLYSNNLILATATAE
jgi:hypothetical protein